MMSLAVYNVGRQKCTPGYRWGPGIRDHYLIHYISAGSGTYTVQDRTFQLKEGDVFLIYPGMAASYQADMRRPWSYEWVGFAGTDARTILDMTDFSPDSLVLTAPSYGRELQRHLRRINQAFGNTFRESISMTGELYSLLALLVDGSSRDRTVRGRDTETVRSAVQFIEQRYSYAISVEDVADYVGVSRSTLFRVFTRQMGVSPKEYLDNYRIDKARFLLRHSELTIGAIAVSVGYDNGLYFSKAFKKITGRTPSSYRQESSGI
jgi:AraC-like DNA-binding protein